MPREPGRVVFTHPWRLAGIAGFWLASVVACGFIVCFIVCFIVWWLA